MISCIDVVLCSHGACAHSQALLLVVQGDQGTTGAQGDQGTTGASGTPGQDAGELSGGLW
jgi:hypothetical protein